jgi:uncharacterized protein YcfL
MKKVVILCFVSVLSVFMLAGCQRDEGVQAGNEQGNTGTYQPRPAPKGDLQSKESGQNQEISGELQRVDMAAKTMTVRLDNGMEQTFKFDDSTMVMGLEGQQGQTTPAKPGKATNAAIRNLVGKEGSEVTVQWRDDNGAKMATQINVTQVSTSSKRSRNSSSNTTSKPKTKSTY